MLKFKDETWQIKLFLNQIDLFGSLNKFWCEDKKIGEHFWKKYLFQQHYIRFFFPRTKKYI